MKKLFILLIIGVGTFFSFIPNVNAYYEKNEILKTAKETYKMSNNKTGKIDEEYVKLLENYLEKNKLNNLEKAVIRNSIIKIKEWAAKNNIKNLNKKTRINKKSKKEFTKIFKNIETVSSERIKIYFTDDNLIINNVDGSVFYKQRVYEEKNIISIVIILFGIVSLLSGITYIKKIKKD